MSEQILRSQKDQTVLLCKQAPGVFIPVVNPNKCEGKAECLSVCPFDMFTIGILPKESRGRLSFKGKLKGLGHGWKQALVTNGAACRECGECVKYCPEKPIILKRVSIPA